MQYNEFSEKFNDKVFYKRGWIENRNNVEKQDFRTEII